MNNTAVRNTPNNSPSRQPLSRRFHLTDEGWYVDCNDKRYGPYPDKATAQTALMYYSQHTAWPDDKQLRHFILAGR